MEFTSHIDFFDSVLWGHFIPVPQEIAKKFIDGDNRRVRCILNGKVEKQSALMPNKGEYFLLINKANLDKLQVRIGDPVNVKMTKDESTYGIDIPEEMQVCLDQDEIGSKWFHELTPGKQRSLIYLVSTVKNPDSRIRKSLAILHHLNEAHGKLDFRRLNEVFKEFNRLK